MNFERNLSIGRVSEGLIAKWIISRGGAVMPAYEIEKAEGKGPQFFGPSGGIVAPDMVVFKQSGICWVEAKHKTVFTWHGITQRWTTGIDTRHYHEYLRVREQTGLPVWILFFHQESKPWVRDLDRWGCPAECPTGLFGDEITELNHKINHTSPAKTMANGSATGHGHSGMTYWAHTDLKCLATMDEVFQASRPVAA